MICALVFACSCTLMLSYTRKFVYLCLHNGVKLVINPHAEACHPCLYFTFGRIPSLCLEFAAILDVSVMTSWTSYHADVN